jgi:hypothetical protein
MKEKSQLIIAKTFRGFIPNFTFSVSLDFSLKKSGREERRLRNEEGEVTHMQRQDNGGGRNIIEEVNSFTIHCTHVRSYHNETPSYY